MALTREKILARKPKTKVVQVATWGDTVMIRSLTVGAAQAITAGQGIIDLVIASVINDDGSPMFSPEDRDELTTKEFAAMKEIADASIEFNAMSPATVEAIAGNSEAGLTNGSSTA
jgi:hypothetical protein